MPVEDIEVFRKSPLVKNFRMLEFRLAFDAYRLKARFYLINGWVLDFFEHEQPKRRLYAYHVFVDTRMIVRWDNAPHHKNIRTFPNHKHIGNRILASREMTASLVLKELKKLM